MSDFAAVCFCVFLFMLSTALIVAENVLMNLEETSSGYSQTYKNR